MRACHDEAILEIAVVDNVVGTNEACKAERLARRIEGNRTLAGIFIDALIRDVRMSRQDQVASDLVRDHDAVMRRTDLIGTFDLFARPNTSTGVVQVAEDNEVDLVPFYLSCHVLIVHAQDTLGIALECRV